MKSLSECRAELDRIDREIVRLFEMRMGVSREVAAYKIMNGLPVLDAAREEAVLASRAGMLEDPYWAQSVRTLFGAVMAISRAEQEKMLHAAKEEP